MALHWQADIFDFGHLEKRNRERHKVETQTRKEGHEDSACNGSGELHRKCEEELKTFFTGGCSHLGDRDEHANLCLTRESQEVPFQASHF